MLERIRHTLDAIREYDSVTEKYFTSLEIIDKISRENTLLNEKVILRDNQIKKLNLKLTETESRRRKNASAIGGFVKKNHLLTEKLKEYDNLLKDAYINLANARNIIVSQNNEIQKLKRKPKLTIENLRKWDRTGKSPRNEERE